MDRQCKAFFSAALIIALFTGCASMPLDRQWQIASDGYSISLSGLNAAYDCGVVNETQFAATAPYQAIASEALDIMDAAANASDADRYKAAKAQMKVAIKRIAEVIKSWSK